MVKLKCAQTVQVEAKNRSDPQRKPEQLTLNNIVALMEHDGYRRVKGRIRQKHWTESR
jgi:hypothetical protein